MTSIWDGATTKAVHANGADPVITTASLVLDWATVTGGSNSLSRYLELDARAASVSVRIPAAPGVAHNGKKLLINVNRDDASTSNFRGVIFTGGVPLERGGLAVRPTYALDRRAGHLALEVVNGVVRIVSGGSFNTDPTLPSSTDLLALLNSWTTGATWAVATDNASDAVVQFNANGNFSPARALSAWLLAAAGGAGGGATEGAGGGAGEFFEDTTFAISALNHALTIGAGGLGEQGWNTPSPRIVQNGGVTSFGALFSLNGGGGGGSHQDLTDTTHPNGAAGGSGGGAGGNGGGEGTAGASVLTGPTGQTPGRFGNAGGENTGRAGGGGGGAGAVGAVGDNVGNGKGGNGGAGQASLITGTSVGYCGGGGAALRQDSFASGFSGDGNTGGGGRGGRAGAVVPIAYNAADIAGVTTAGAAAMNGRANSGGGGGGAGFNSISSTLRIGGTGGSGVVVLRMPLVGAIGL